MDAIIAFLGSNPSGWGAFALLVGFVVFAMVRDWLVAAPQVKSQLKSRDLLVAASNLRAEDWKQLLSTEQAINATLRARLDATESVAVATNKVLDIVADKGVTP